MRRPDTDTPKTAPVKKNRTPKVAEAAEPEKAEPEAAEAAPLPTALENNSDALFHELHRMRVHLERYIARTAGDNALQDDALADEDWKGPPSALDYLVHLFSLSPFERDLLILCAGMELDEAFPALCARASGDASRPYPTFGLGFACLTNPHWDALSPSSPLRKWRMLELGPPQNGGAGVSAPLTLGPLSIDERVLNFLVGIPQTDERVAGTIEVCTSAAPLPLVPSHQNIAQQITDIWAQYANTTQSRNSAPGDASLPPKPLVQLCGGDTQTRRDIALWASRKANRPTLLVLRTDALPHHPTEQDALLRLWEREALLQNGTLCLEANDENVAAEAAPTHELIANRIASRAGALSGVPLIVSGRERRKALGRTTLSFEVAKPTTSEQRLLWQAALCPPNAVSGANSASENPRLSEAVAQITAHFDMGAQAIRTVGAHLAARQAEKDAPEVAAALWEACRTQSRTGLEALAQRIETGMGWDDLVLPVAQQTILRGIAAHVRQRMVVYEQWGFGGKGGRGLGISAMFAGVSGTGKTTAAEVLARELHLDLFRIDLSQVVSKFIGETEKNLSRVFEAAEEAGAVLLFDEADALFGKRSEVKDSHDRYANVEVSYLLQRMETYKGLAILTTNLKSSIDTAFLRRIRFVIQFPFPGPPERAEIWRRIFPPAAPTEGLDPQKLAQLTVSGGNIKNMALNAAFLAADEHAPVQMRHIYQAAHAEYAKLEKTLTETETAGWL